MLKRPPRSSEAARCERDPGLRSRVRGGASPPRRPHQRDDPFRAVRDEDHFEYGLCSYEDKQAPPPEVAYGPTCPLTADGAGSLGFSGGRTFGLIALFPYSNDSGDELGLGAWISAPATIELAGAHALLLGFE